MLLAILALFTGARAIDTVGTYGCSSITCVFSNPYLRFGTGAENSVNAWGLFVQPWYFSSTANTWYKLTFNNYPLDTAIGTGTGSAQWSGTTVVDLYSLTPSNPSTDYTGFYVNSSDTTKTVGYGVIVANRTFTVSGNQVILQNTFSLGAADRFVKIVTRVINTSPNVLNNTLIWTGTRDDYVGTTDVNTKTRGNLNTGSFVAVTTNSQSSRAIMITNTNEGVLFYSETPGVMTAYSSCCAFANVYNTNPLSLPPMTITPTDGSYAAVLPIGTLATEMSGAITWYYAAGVITALSQVAQSVAVAQAIDSGVQLVSTDSSSATSSASATMSSYFTDSPFSSYSSFATNTSTGSVTATPSSSQTPSNGPVRVVFVDAPRAIINITEVFTTVDNVLMLSIFIPIALAVLCLVTCNCIVALCYLKKKRAEDKVERIRNELFTRVPLPN
jgi:hypothetical protein